MSQSSEGPEGRAGGRSDSPPDSSSDGPSDGPGDSLRTRRSGELTARELGRFAWRQLTSMRTALILLLLLALAAVPGSVIPQESVDSFGARQWKEQHETLAPIYERLGLFDVYGSVWFAAVYVLLMISLIGCILPRSRHYWRAARAVPPAAPRHLTRLPDHATYRVEASPEEVLAAARAELRRRRYRLRPDADSDSGTGSGSGSGTVSAERGYLREAGNLLFHLSVIVVLVGFAMGGLLGYKGGVIILEGAGFSNNLTQYDDFVPGSLFTADEMEPFSFDVDSFEVEWLREGPGQGMARAFEAALTYRTSPSAPERTYDLRVNHPLKIGDSEVFLVGHGYAPVVTVRGGDGEVAYSGPTVFLPQDASFFSFGVVKAIPAQPEPIGLEGFFYPFFASVDGDPFNVAGEDRNPVLSVNVYVGDLGLEDGASQSVYILDKSRATQLENDEGRPLRLDLNLGDTVELPDGLGSVTFESVTPWVRVQVSQTPGKRIALGGVVLALVGLCGSLFIRPRRVFLRVVATEDGSGSDVELAALDRSGGGDTAVVVDDLRLAIVTALDPTQEEPR